MYSKIILASQWKELDCIKNSATVSFVCVCAYECVHAFYYIEKENSLELKILKFLSEFHKIELCVLRCINGNYMILISSSEE